MTKPADFHARRVQLMHLLPVGAVVVLIAASKKRRSNDTFYRYRQDSTFLYLTGYKEAPCKQDEEAILVMIGKSTWLFRREPSAHHLRWEGTQPSNTDIEQAGRFTEVLPLEQFAQFREKVKKQSLAVYGEPSRQEWYKSWLGRDCLDGTAHVATMRMIKSEGELSLMQRACDITTQAHRETMIASRSMDDEHCVAAFFQWQCMQQQAQELAYSSIVATGKNACILHYTSLKDKLGTQDTILMDAGAEVEGYAADITRVWPRSGAFTAEQRALYEAVLTVQKTCLENLQPGITLQALHKISEKASCQALIDLGLLQGNIDTVLAEGSHKRYFCHAIGHSIGLDVHDPMPKDTALGENMVVTIEPGLYIPTEDDGVPEGFRGIGIRIEDMAVLTKDSHRVMSENLEKSVMAVEQLSRG